MSRPSTTLDVRSAVRTMGLSLGVAVALWFLRRGSLATPPIDSWTRFHDWLGERSTAAAAIASLRATGALVALYVGIVSALAIVAEVTSFVRLGRVARAIVPRSMRPLVGVALGAGVATAAASLAVPRTNAPTHIATLALDPPSDATATMYLVSEPGSATTIAPAVTTVGTATEIPPELLVEPAPPPVPEPLPAPATTPPAAAPRSWTIERGEHLWAVARETLADSWQRPPTDAEVVPYWRDLIERNRSRLIDPSNPDYVLAGQVFELPEVPARR